MCIFEKKETKIIFKKYIFMANSIDGNCRYNMIVRIGYILLIICVVVQCEHDETAKTHVGMFKEMNKDSNYYLFLV
jgi:hypothetical protein